MKIIYKEFELFLYLNNYLIFFVKCKKKMKSYNKGVINMFCLVVIFRNRYFWIFLFFFIFVLF